MRKHKNIRTEGLARHGPDLPEELQESVDSGQLFTQLEVESVEKLVRGVKLDAATINKLRLESCVLEQVAVPRSIIHAATWKDVRFSGCDFANTEIRALTAARVEFLACRMTGLHLGQAECQSLLVFGGDQRYAQLRFCSFRKSEFDNCDLQDADFYGADLRGCVFRRCNLRNVEMSKAKLVGTDFRGSIVEGLRLGAEDIVGAIVDAAQALTFAPLLGLKIS